MYFFTLILSTWVPGSFCPEYGHRSLKLEIAEMCVIIWESLPDCNSETSMLVCELPQGLDLMVLFRESLTHNSKIGYFTQCCGSCCLLFECCYYHQFVFIMMVSALFQEVEDLILFSLQFARMWTHAYLCVTQGAVTIKLKKRMEMRKTGLKYPLS